MKYVLVTGAYGGMGRATVSLLVKKGYYVFALDKKTGEAQPNVIPIEADLTNLQSVTEAYQRVTAVTNELFAIIHFAGRYCLDSLVEMDEKSFTQAFDINVFGAYRVNKVFLPLLKQGSKIVITTSELAPLDPLPYTGIYAITKSALDKYAYSLRMELQLLSVSVSVLRPGAVDTGMLGVSTDALDKFCAKTERFSGNASRFKSIVESVEARKISPDKIAEKTAKILASRRPRHVYKINRNPLLLLLNLLPGRLQTWIINKILK